MNLSQRIVIVMSIALLGGGLILYRTVDRMYLTPRAELQSQIESARETVNRYRSALNGRARLNEQLQSYVNQTLGGDMETVDHRLRTRLNRIAEELQVQSVSVNTSSPSALGSPARGLFRGRAMRDLRDELDFVEKPATISAEGTLAQVVELIDRMSAEPWQKRIDQVRLDPRDNGQRFGVTVRLTTLFLPGRAPEREPRETYDTQRLAQFASLTSANPFHLPPPEPERETQVARRLTPPSFPFEQWVLTGVAEGSGGVEAWLTNRRTGESLRIAPGEQLDEITLIAAQGEQAEFANGDERFMVVVGSDLNDRLPLAR